jgi:hypothetical protein
MPADWPKGCPEPPSTAAEQGYRHVCEAKAREIEGKRLANEQGAGPFKPVDWLPFARERCVAVQCPPAKILAYCETAEHSQITYIPEQALMQVIVEKCAAKEQGAAPPLAQPADHP